MRVSFLALLILAATAFANVPPEDMPANLRFGPFYEISFAASGLEMQRDTYRLLPGGTHWEHTVRYRNGRTVRHVYEVPKFR